MNWQKVSVWFSWHCPVKLLIDATVVEFSPKAEPFPAMKICIIWFIWWKYSLGNKKKKSMNNFTKLPQTILWPSHRGSWSGPSVGAFHWRPSWSDEQVSVPLLEFAHPDLFQQSSNWDAQWPLRRNKACPASLDRKQHSCCKKCGILKKKKN